MTITVGQKLPEATFLKMGDKGPETVELGAKLAGRKVAIFAMPGAFSATCSGDHIPNILMHKEALEAKGVEEILIVCVNDPYVMRAWEKSSAAEQGELTFLADSDAQFSKAMGLTFDAPVIGFYDRSQRYAMLVDDGVVAALLIEEKRAAITTSGADALLAAI